MRSCGSADETRSNPGDALGHADRRLRAVPDPDRRVGRLRAAAVRARGPGRRDVRHAVHVRADADRGGQGGARGAAGGVHPGVVGRAVGGGGRARRDRHRGRRAERGGGPGPAAAGDPPDRRPVAARVAGGVVRDRPAAAVRGAVGRRAGGHRGGRPDVHRLLREEPGRVPGRGRRAVL